MTGLGELRRLAALAGLRPARMAAAVALGVVAVVSGAALLGVSGYLLCTAAGQPPILSLTVLTVVVRALALARPTARYGERLVAHDLALRGLGRLRAAVFARLEPLAPGGLEAFRHGDLLTRTVADVDELQDVALRLVLPVAVAVVSGAAIATGVAVVLPAAGAVLAVGLAVGGASAALVAARGAARARRRQAAARARLATELVDAMDAAAELWLNEADGPARAQVAEADAELVALSLADARAAGRAEAAAVAAGGLTMVAVLAVAWAAASGGSLDARLVGPLALVSMGAFEVVVAMGTAARHLPAVRAAGARVQEIFDAVPPVEDPATPVELDGAAPTVLARHLEVVRGGVAVPALRRLDLEVPPGGRVVVTGPSGAGKSTLAEVLVRFLERRGGDAALAGHDLRRLRQDDVRRAVLLSAQEPYVFDSTIRENLALARPGATDDELVAALDLAALSGWIATLPDGLGTRVGERGRALSGGQRQRLALARAVLADPAVVLLDEPTAHVDDETAARLLDDLWEATAGRSVVLVTHGPAGPFGGAPKVDLGPAAASAEGAQSPSR